jgi:hypothetical protein
MAKKPAKKPIFSDTTARAGSSASKTRTRKLNKRERAKKTKTTQRSKPLPKARVLLWQSLKQLYANKKLFIGIIAVYGVLYLLFVKGISANFQLGSLKDNLTTALGGKMSALGTGVALYGLLLGSASTTSNDSGGIYQTLLIIIVSLALIWALRQTHNKTVKLRTRDAYYKGMFPLVPFAIILIIMFVQFLPALITASLYSVASNSATLATTPEKVVGIGVLLAGLIWTFYMISSSLFAMYIVTLSGATPMASLKAAKQLVRYRRQIIFRKVVFVPAVLLLFSAVVLIPLIILAPPVAEVLFALATIALPAVLHSYFYNLYRSLLND